MYSKSISFDKAGETYRIPELVQLACTFSSRISVSNNYGQFDAKSIMGMMSLDPRDGVLIIRAEGEDEKAAVEALYAFMNGKTDSKNE